MNDDLQPIEEPVNLRFLRRLVTGLTATMIVGLATIVGLFVMRFWGAEQVPLPASVTLPAGMAAQAVTYGADWYAVVTDGNEILIFNRDDGTLRQRIQIDMPAE